MKTKPLFSYLHVQRSYMSGPIPKVPYLLLLNNQRYTYQLGVQIWAKKKKKKDIRNVWTKNIWWKIFSRKTFKFCIGRGTRPASHWRTGSWVRRSCKGQRCRRRPSCRTKSRASRHLSRSARTRRRIRRWSWSLARSTSLYLSPSLTWIKPSKRGGQLYSDTSPLLVVS